MQLIFGICVLQQFSKFSHMTAQLKKLKGSTVKTLIGDITFKQYYRLDDSQFDQIYFKTNGIDSICKIYDLAEVASEQRFKNEKQQYSKKSLTMMYTNVHCEEIKIKKNRYGLVILQRLDKQQSLVQCMVNLSQYQKYKLTIKLMELLLQLKQNKKIYCNIRPSNIYKYADTYAIINTQYLADQGFRNNMDSFMLETIQNQWRYWPCENIDTYSNQPFDYALDVYAVGCILYECLTAKYPFQTKLSATNGQYVKLDNKDILNQVTEMCLSPSARRRTLNLKYMIAKLKQSMSQIRPAQNTSIVEEPKYRKGSNNGIFENLSNVFTKMMNDSQGWYLNYVQDTDSAPNQKYLDNILAKMYKKQEKADKLYSIIQRFISNNPNKINSIKKNLLLIGQAIRRGPEAALNLIPIIGLIKSQYSHVQLIVKFATMLQKKVELLEKVKKILCGNYYLSQISMFKKLSIADLKAMSNYLSFLISQINNQLQSNGELSQSISYFACDQIYDLICMIIISTISIRKDNELQLRSDNMSQLKPIEKDMNTYLKKLSYLSNLISAHAIYSLQGQYIPYQEQLMLKSNPYYSTLEYFYYNNRNYKGLTIPTDYASVFSGNKQQKKVYSANKQSKTIIEPNGKFYFKEQINSDEDEQFSRGHKSPTQTTSSKRSEIKIETTNGHNINIKQVESKKESKLIKDLSPSRGSKLNKAQLTISFEQFGNIHQIADKTPKNFNQFAFFNQIKKQTIKRPPLPQKVEQTKPKQQKIQSNFFEFDQIFDKKQNKNKNNAEVKAKSNVFPEFNQLNQSKIPVNFDAFNQMLLKPEPVNPLVTKMLQGLKLKQLKDLITKNKKYVIDFGQLKLEKVIGSGSAGQVYYGLYKDQKVAIKKVKAKQNPNALKQFERQLVTYIKIKTNPNLVSLIGVSESNTDFYLITQFCSQGSLFDLLHKKKLQIVLTWKQRLNFAIEIAEGMHFLHSMNPIIIHRDLKSLNVFVTKTGSGWKMKVADFGLSRSPEAEMMTTQLGTIHWMAPELLQSKQYSFKVDVYSYGILLWQILARTTPYSNLLNPVAILKYVVFDKNRPEKQAIPKQCPAQLIQIMEKCWAHEPNDRPTFSQVIRLLKLITL